MEDHRVKGERTLKERAPARKGIPGLRAWLARHGALAEGAPAVLADCAQGLDPGRRARTPGGSGHWRPGGQDHPDGNCAPRGLSNQGDNSHEGYHGGQ